MSRKFNLRSITKRHDKGVIAERHITLVKLLRRRTGFVFRHKRLIDQTVAGVERLGGGGERSVFGALILVHVMEIIVDHDLITEHFRRARNERYTGIRFSRFYRPA